MKQKFLQKRNPRSNLSLHLPKHKTILLIICEKIPRQGLQNLELTKENVIFL